MNWWQNKSFDFLIECSFIKAKSRQRTFSQCLKSLREGILSFTSVQFSRSFVSHSLRPRESQHARPPSPSPTPGVHPNSCPLSGWCHPAISPSVVPYSSCPQSLPASGPITSWEIDGETVSDFIFGGSKITADGDCSHEIKRRLLLEGKLWPT